MFLRNNLQKVWPSFTVGFVNTQERADNSVLELFCNLDDFCKICRPMMVVEAKIALPNESGKVKKIRKRATKIDQSEIMTILIYFHQSGYKEFKIITYMKYYGVVRKNFLLPLAIVGLLH